MQYEPFKDYSIFGERRGEQAIVTRKGMPGFAPEFRDEKVCELVIVHPRDLDVPFAQFFDYSGYLYPRELRELADKLEALTKDEQQSGDIDD